MKSRMQIISLLLAASCLLLSGCSGTPITLKSFPAEGINLASSRPVSAEACGFQLLLWIPININTRLERAFNELQEKAGNDLLANLGIQESWKYAFVGTVYCTKLDALAYQKSAKK